MYVTAVDVPALGTACQPPIETPTLTPPQIVKLRSHLDPLRSGTPLVSSSELDTLDADWTRWRAEWIHRRKVFYKCVRRAYYVFGKQMIDALLLASGRLWRIRFPRLMLNSLRRILGSSMIRLNMLNWSADHCVALLKGAESIYSARL